jgi:hypothetical protein
MNRSKIIQYTIHLEPEPIELLISTYKAGKEIFLNSPKSITRLKGNHHDIRGFIEANIEEILDFIMVQYDIKLSEQHRIDNW